MGSSAGSRLGVPLCLVHSPHQHLYVGGRHSQTCTYDMRGCEKLSVGVQLWYFRLVVEVSGKDVCVAGFGLRITSVRYGVYTSRCHRRQLCSVSVACVRVNRGVPASVIAGARMRRVIWWGGSPW